ncbi:flagellar basal body L-ring protein FlgH [Halanaerobaculum tunisiense]
MYRKTGALIIILVILLATTGQAASLWNETESVYSDNGKYEAGDILTIMIQEDAAANQQASTDVSQSNQANAGAGTGIFDFIDSFGFNESDSSTATGTTSRSGNLSAEVTVEVAEVLDNGNLKITGEKQLTINNEEQQIKLDGIIRPEDITADNSIDSTYVAQLNIDYQGQGAIGDKQQPGMITRVLNYLF